MPEIASHICTKVHLAYLQLILVFQDLFLSIDCRLDMSPIFKSKMVHTPLGPPTTWVHILLDTLEALIEYLMNNDQERRRR
jgi:hypothetical protein